MEKFLKTIIMCTILAICGCGNSNNNADQNSDAQDQEVDTTKFVFDNPDAANASGKTWDVTTESDPMTDAKTLQAVLTSDEVIETDAQMYKNSTLTITITKNQNGAYKVVVNTEGILCKMHQPDNIKVRFDRTTPEKFSYRSKDGLNLNIKEPDKFVDSCMKAKDIIIEVHNVTGSKVLTSFHVDKPLDWNSAN